VKLVTTTINSDAVLDFWLGAARYQADAIKTAKQRWYKKGHLLDTPIKAQFSDLLSQVSQERSSKADKPQTRTAKVIILDQFSRHIYRGTADAWRHDELAQHLTLDTVNNQTLHPLTPSEQLFLWHPLHHSEDLTMQHLALTLLENLLDNTSREWHLALKGFMTGWQSHAAIIAEFGRFPHRNSILGRINTEKELRYLQKSQKNYGQK
jgi:uncharacterized protein (DUF924 family)